MKNLDDPDLVNAAIPSKPTTTRHTGICMLILATIMLAIFGFDQRLAHADTHIYVDALNGINGPEVTGTEADPFQTISLALAMAANRGLEDPWVVHIKAGRYDSDPDKDPIEREVFPINLRSGMILKGDDGPENCIVSGKFTTGGASPLVKGKDVHNITIQDLTFEELHRTSNGDPDGGGGGAMDLINTSGKITDCRFVNNSTTIYVDNGGGGAVWLSIPEGTPFVFDRNLFSNNIVGTNSSTYTYGGAVYIRGHFQGSISGNTFTGNAASNGGGFCTSGDFIGQVVKNTFAGNYRVGGNNFRASGIGFSISGSFYGDILQNVFNQNFNSTIYGAGFYIQANMEGNIERNIFTGNYASISALGLGFKIRNMKGKITNNIFSGNYSTGKSNMGSAIYIYGSMNSQDPEDIFIANNLFLYNVNTYQLNHNWGESTIFLGMSPATIVNNTFYGGYPEDSQIYLSTTAAGTIIKNNIFANLDTAIEQDGDYFPTIENNDFDESSILNMYKRNSEPLGDTVWFIDLMTDNCSNNKDWQPKLVGENIESGVWTDSVSYDPQTNLTTLTDQTKNWKQAQWRGSLLNISYTSLPLHFKIVDNTKNQIRILGNISEINAGDAYAIDNYQLTAASQNNNTAVDVGLTDDFDGDMRPSQEGFDIGADEFYPSTGNIFKITAEANFGGEITPDGTSYVNEGQNQDYIITAYNGYYISDILIDDVSIGATDHYEFSFVSQDHTIKAQFSANFDQFTITASSGTGGHITPVGNTFVQNQGSLTLSIIPDNDFQVLDVLVDNSSVGAVTEYTFSSVSENHTIYATFEYIGSAGISEITMQLNKDGIMLGEVIVVTGQMTTPPTLGGAFIDIALTPPTGEIIHQTTIANTLGEFSHELACDDITMAGTWSVQASWKGDYLQQGATSNTHTLSVAKAQTQMTLDSSNLAIKIGDPVPFISGIFLPSPQCEADYSGLPIHININGPNGESDQVDILTNDQWGHFSLADYNGLTSLGTWTLQAVFDGDDSYQAVISDEMTIQVVETAGYAIIVQGKLSNEEGIESHNKTCNLVYNTLINRGLQDEDIFYFNYDTAQTGVDALPTWSGIQDAVTIWARDKMNVKPANLFIIMIDHGFDEQFHIDTDDTQVVITSADLDTWQTTLQTNLTGDAEDQEIISILGFCRSGSFMNELSGPNRVVITSAAPEESSYKGPMDLQDFIREGEYFVAELFKAASYGKSIRQCFEEAVVLIESFTSSDRIFSNNSPFGDNSRQHPLLDDNGDGMGSNDLADSGDGEFSDTLFFGITPVTGNDPGDVSVIAVSDTLFLSDTENSTMFWARVNNNTRMSSLWAEIKAPGHDPADSGTTGQATMDLDVVVLTQYDAGWNYYQPAAAPDVFTEPGIYYIYYFAKDAITGHISSLKQSMVYKNAAGNQAPENFHLLYPNPIDDPVFRTTGFILGWQTTIDPDGDSLTYTVKIISDPTDTRWSGQVFNYTLENLTQGMAFIGEEALFTQKRRYVWQVTAIDQYGAATTSIETNWAFEIDNDNAINGWISGGVYDDNNSTIVHADVSVAGFSVEMLTDNSGTSTGYYIGSGHPGTYQLTATASGYNLNTRQVTLLNGGFTTGDISLSVLNQIPGDFNGDGQVDNDDIEVLGLDFGDADCTPENPCSADADEDGDVDGLDMIELINAF